MKTVEQLRIDIIGNATRFVQATRQAEASVNRLGRNWKTANASLEQSMARLNAQVARMSKRMEQLTHTQQRFVSRLHQYGFGGLLGGAMTSSVLEMAETYKAYRAQLKIATKSQQEYNRALEDVASIARAAHTDISSTAKLYARMLPSLKQFGFAQQDAAKAVELFSKSLQLTGPSTQEAQSAILQFAQAMGSGVLRGEEFNSIMENANGVAQMLADGLGVPIGRLRELAEQGELTTDIVVKALLKQEAAINDAFSKLPPSLSRAMTDLKNSMTEYVGSTDDALSATRTLASGITLLAENFSNVANAVITGMFVGAAVKAGRAATMLAININRASAATLTLAGSVKALRTAMLALISTPIGLAITAMGAAYLALNARQEEVSETADKLRERMHALNKEMSEATIRRRAEELVEYRNQLEALLDMKKQNPAVDVFGVKEARLRNYIRRLENGLEAKVKLERATKPLIDLEAEYNAQLKKEMDAQLDAAIAAERRLDAQYEATMKLKEAEKRRAQEAAREISQLESAYRSLLRTIDPISAEMEDYFDRLDLLDKLYKKHIITLEQLMEAQAKLHAQLNKPDKDVADKAKPVIPGGDYYKMLAEQTAEFDQAAKQAEQQLDALLDKTASLGDTWTRTGNQVLDALGSMSAALIKQARIEAQYNEAIKKARQEDALSLTRLKEMEQARALVSIKGSKDMLAAASAMFKKGSAEAKAAHDAYMAMSAVELAMNMQKAISAATVAVANQGQGDPYTAFARVAAMSAMMAGVLSNIGASFSSSGRSAPAAVKGQPAPDAGVLGGGTSVSVENALDYMKDIEAKQYKALRGIFDEIQQLNRNITGVVSTLYGTGDISGLSSNTAYYKNGLGDDIGHVVGSFLKVSIVLDNLTGMVSGAVGALARGLFGGGTSVNTSDYGIRLGGTLGAMDVQGYETLQYSKEPGWFQKTKTWDEDRLRALSDQTRQSIALVFANMRNAFSEIGQQLNRDIDKALDGFKVDIGKISLTGDSEKVRKKLTEAFSAQSDKLAYALFPDLIAAYRKVNESAFDTLSRLVTDKAVVADTLSMTGQKLIGDAIATSEALVELAGGLKQLREAAETYYDKFYTDAEKQARLQKQLFDALKRVNLALPKTRDGYRAMVESLDLTTEAGRKAYVALMEAADSADKFYSAFEQQIKSLTDMLDSAYKSIVGQSVDALTYTQAQSRLYQMIQQARSGLLPDSKALSNVLNVLTHNREENYASYADFVRDQRTSANAIKTLRDLVGGQLDTSALMLEELKKQTRLLTNMDAATASIAVDIVNGLTHKFDQIDSSLDGLIDYNEFKNYFSSLEGVTEQQLKALYGLLDTNGDGQISQLEASNAKMRDMLESLETIDFNTAGTTNNTAQLAVQKGIEPEKVVTVETPDFKDPVTKLADGLGIKKPLDDAVKSVSDGLTSLADSLGLKFASGGYTGDGGVNQPAGIVHKGEYVLPQWMVKLFGGKAFVGALESLRLHGSHASGLSYVPFDGYRAELHKGEAVIDAGSMKALRKYGIALPQVQETRLQRIEAQLERVNQTLESGFFAVARNTGETAETLNRWDYDGMPEVRN